MSSLNAPSTLLGNNAAIFSSEDKINFPIDAPVTTATISILLHKLLYVSETLQIVSEQLHSRHISYRNQRQTNPFFLNERMYFINKNKISQVFCSTKLF